MRTSRWLLCSFVLCSCDLYSSFAKRNDQNCTLNPDACSPEQVCSPITDQCEPRPAPDMPAADMAETLAEDMAVPPSDMAVPTMTQPDLGPDPAVLSFNVVPLAQSLTTQISGIDVGDLNKDNFADIVYTNALTDELVVLLNSNGTTTFQSPKTFLALATGSAMPRIADLDGDGQKDIAFNTTVGNSVSVRTGDGTGNFSARTSFPTGAQPADLAIADT